MSQPSLSISLLGPPLVVLNGKTVEIKRRKVRFLLYYLACQLYPVSRENLCEMFWPDDTEEISKKNLREALANLKKSLPGDDYLLINGDYVSLDGTKVVVDTIEFEKITQLIRKNLNISLNSSFTDVIYTKVSEGISLWRASGFITEAGAIDSENFQQWASDRNEIFEVWHQMMLEWLADQCISTGHLNEALNWLSLALLHDRQNTELNILVLKCLKDLGAISELKYFCVNLEKIYVENGKSILPKVLRDMIETSRGLLEIPQEEPRWFWLRDEKNPMHYVDLCQRVADLRTRLQRGGIFYVRGEAGCGKSRFLREFYDALEVLPRLLYYQSCPHEVNIAYQPLIGSIRQTISDSEWNVLDPSYARALLPLFPEIQRIRQDISPSDLAAAAGLQRLIPEAFWELLKIIGHDRKVLYIFDDAHWCDAETMQVLTYVFEQDRADEYGTAILCGQTDIANPALDKFIARYADTRYMQVVDLPLLTQDEVSDFTYLLTGIMPQENEVRWLTRECGGNPKLLSVFLKDQFGPLEEIRQNLAGGQYKVKGDLFNAIKRRLSRNSEEEIRTLQAAAWLGSRFSISDLVQVSGRDALVIEEVLKKFQRENTIRRFSDPAENIEFEFSQEMIHRYLVQTTPVESIFVFKSLAGSNN
jgi:DNA-binding SARP family transcriptional activator